MTGQGIGSILSREGLSLPLTRSFLQSRVTALEAQIASYEAAITALGPQSAIKSYTLHTGQSQQIVSRRNLQELMETRDSLLSQLSLLNAQLCGSVTIRVGAGW